MYNRIIIIITLSILIATSSSSQQIEAISNTFGDTTVKVINLDNIHGASRTIYAEGRIALTGKSEFEGGVGVLGESTNGWGVIGIGRPGRGGVRGNSVGNAGVSGNSSTGYGVQGESNSGYGVFGESSGDIGVVGQSVSSYGIFGTSFDRHGAKFRGNNSDGFADIILAGGNWFGGSDDGVIMSDQSWTGSDIFIVANDAIVLEIGKRPSQNGTFEIWNTNDSDKLMTLNESGNMVIKGTLSQGSDINRKERIQEINTLEILDKVATLAVTEWNYIGEDIRHIGPMAQDFHAAFGLGDSETSITAIDVDGIALASIKAMKKLIAQLESKVQQLESKVSDLEQIKASPINRSQQPD